MDDLQIMRYFRKYWGVIVIGSLITGILFYIVAKFNIQEYTAATVIEYTNPEAEKGLAPDGTEIEPSEIYGSNIIAQTMNELELNPSNFSIDKLRSGIEVKPFAAEEEQSESEMGDNAKTDINSSMYLVTFSSAVSYGKEFPRKVLNQILECYFAYYGQKHVNSAGIANSIQDIYTKDYDYIEMAEVIEASLDETLDWLQAKEEIDSSFHSVGTGLSFADLYDEFSFIKETELSQLTADILLYKVTKDRETLLSKYRNRKNALASANSAYSSQNDRIRGVLYYYEEAIGRFGHEQANADGSGDREDDIYNHILADIYEGAGQETANGMTQESAEQITEYDRLLLEYSESRTFFEYNNIESDYDQYIINVFVDAPAASEKVQNEIIKRFQALIEKTNALYQDLGETNDEYNDYLGAQNLVLRASVGVSEKIPLGIFAAMSAAVFGMIGFMGVAVFGRLEETKAIKARRM